MDSRQQFEEWVVGRKVVKKHGAKLNTTPDGTYCDYRINDRWLAWQASRELLVIELPQASYSGVDTGGWPNDYSENRRNSAIDECRKSIRAAGIRTK